MKKTLIVTKDLNSMGGVVNYYRVFFRVFKDDSWQVEPFIVGRRAGEYYQKKSILKYIWQYLSDMARFFHVLSSDKHIRIVQFSPSMIPVPLIRDSLLLLAAKLMKRKTILFIRGWDDTFVDKIIRQPWLNKTMVWLCGQTDKVVVLADRFKQVLVNLGVPENRIDLSRTMFDGNLVLPYQKDKSVVTNFLFLGRISEAKGVFEIVKAAFFLKAQDLDFRLKFVGFGKDAEIVDRLKQYIKLLQLDNIFEFKGFLDGKIKYEEYANADVFLLPSIHPEGCPNSVLEAMASGLFVISTGVGALNEVVKHGENGLIVKKMDTADLAEKMGYVIKNLNKVRCLGHGNVQYAFENFESEKIVTQFIEMYSAITNNVS